MTATQKLFAVVALSLMSAISWAEGKIVVLDPTAAIMGTAAAKARFEKMQKGADFAATKAKLDGLTADIKALQAAYKKDSMTWDDTKRAESEKKMQSLAADYQFEGKKLQGEQQALAQQLMQEMAPKMEAIVKQLVESEKITMIVDAKSVMMAKPEHDLTQKVTELLNKAK